MTKHHIRIHPKVVIASVVYDSLVARVTEFVGAVGSAQFVWFRKLNCVLSCTLLDSVIFACAVSKCSFVYSHSCIRISSGCWFMCCCALLDIWLTIGYLIPIWAKGHIVLPSVLFRTFVSCILRIQCEYILHGLLFRSVNFLYRSGTRITSWDQWNICMLLLLTPMNASFVNWENVTTL